MRRFGWKRFLSRYRGPAGKRRALRGAMGLLLLFGLFFGAASEAALRAIPEDTLREAAEEALREQIAQAVEETLNGREDALSLVCRDADGTVTAVSSDAGALNDIKAGVLRRLEDSFRRGAWLRVPLGSFTGLGVLNGRGPKARLRLDLTGSADVRFDTSFLSAGVNQSLHRITMTVTAWAVSPSRRFMTEASAETVTVLEENVVVGAVPGAALIANPNG